MCRRIDRNFIIQIIVLYVLLIQPESFYVRFPPAIRPLIVTSNQMWKIDESGNYICFNKNYLRLGRCRIGHPNQTTHPPDTASEQKTRRYLRSAVLNSPPNILLSLLDSYAISHPQDAQTLADIRRAPPSRSYLPVRTKTAITTFGVVSPENSGQCAYPDFTPCFYSNPHLPNISAPFPFRIGRDISLPTYQSQFQNPSSLRITVLPWPLSSTTTSSNTSSST
jgi:hypothetical protein